MNPNWKWLRVSIICAVYISVVGVFCYWWWLNAESEWVVGTFALGLIGAVSLALALWQDNKGQVLPTVDGYHAAMIPGGLSLIAIVVPAVLYAGASGPMMRPDTSADALDASLIIGLVFGGAEMLALGVSLAVLVQIQTAFTGEKELMKHAIDALQLVRKELIFVTLTPNLGYADCVRRNDAGAIDAFHRAMMGALEGLLHEMTRSKPVRVFVATLSVEDIARFYLSKAHGLKDYPGLAAGDTGASSYFHRSQNLTARLGEILKEMSEIPLARCVVRTFPECFQNSDAALQVKPNMVVPPLGFLLADDRMGVVFFHDRLVTDRPMPLRGYITKDPEQVRALADLSDIYVPGDSEPVTGAANAQGGNTSG